MEQYTNDGQGTNLITNLYESKKLEYQQSLNTQQSNNLETGSNISSSANINTITNTVESGVDLEIIRERIKIEQVKGTHKKALSILSELIEEARSASKS